MRSGETPDAQGVKSKKKHTKGIVQIYIHIYIKRFEDVSGSTRHLYFDEQDALAHPDDTDQDW